MNSPSILLPLFLLLSFSTYHLQINNFFYLSTNHQTVINTNTNHRVRGKSSLEVWEDAGGYYFT